MFIIYILYVELIVLLLLSLYSDYKRTKIDNKIVFPFMFAGLATNGVVYGISGVLDSAQGIIIPFVLLFLLFVLRMLGAGDIKLFCAIGGIMGFRFSVYSVAYSFLCGGVIAFFLILLNKNAIERFKYLFHYLKRSIFTMTIVPYTNFSDKKSKDKFKFGYAIFLGTLLNLICVVK